MDHFKPFDKNLPFSNPTFVLPVDQVLTRYEQALVASKALYKEYEVEESKLNTLTRELTRKVVASTCYQLPYGNVSVTLKDIDDHGYRIEVRHRHIYNSSPILSHFGLVGNYRGPLEILVWHDYNWEVNEPTNQYVIELRKIEERLHKHEADIRQWVEAYWIERKVIEGRLRTLQTERGRMRSRYIEAQTEYGYAHLKAITPDNPLIFKMEMNPNPRKLYPYLLNDKPCYIGYGDRVRVGMMDEAGMREVTVDHGGRGIFTRILMPNEAVAKLISSNVTSLDDLITIIKRTDAR